MSEPQMRYPADLGPLFAGDEASLARELKAGNEAALRALMERHWVELVQYALRFAHTQDQAEDLVQEAFVRLWSKRGTWRQTETLRPVLFRLTRNLALNEKRRRTTLRRWLDKLRWSEEDPRPSLHRQMNQNDLEAIVQGAVDALPERRREIYVLVRVYQMTYREASEALGIAPQTVANQMTKAMEDLRKALAPYLDAYGPEGISFHRSEAD